MVQMTVPVDGATARVLSSVAGRCGKSPRVLRDATAGHTTRPGRVTEAERCQMREDRKTVMGRPATRSETELDREIETLGQSGVTGGAQRRRGMIAP